MWKESNGYRADLGISSDSEQTRFLVYYDAPKHGFGALRKWRRCLYRGVDRRSGKQDMSFEIDIRRSDLGLLLQTGYRVKWERITKDIVVKLPSVSSGYDANWV
ncbi:hypothetical protein Tco_0281164 [Tanacetum coccineum]